MQIISFDEIIQFTYCPARWLYEHHYKVDYPVHVSEVYHQTMREAIADIFRSILINGTVLFDDVVSRWSDTFMAAAIKTHIPADFILEYQKRGGKVLTTIFNRLSNLHILNINIPWKSEWAPIDVAVKGSIIALVSGSLVPKNEDENAFFVVDVVPAYAGFRISQTNLSLYHLPRHAVAGSAAGVSASRFKLALIDVFDGSIHVEPAHNVEDAMPLFGNIVAMMVDKLVVPNSGQHCSGCPYRQVCSSTHLDPAMLESPEILRAKLEEIICLIAGNSTRTS